MLDIPFQSLYIACRVGHVSKLYSNITLFQCGFIWSIIRQGTQSMMVPDLIREPTGNIVTETALFRLICNIWGLATRHLKKVICDNIPTCPTRKTSDRDTCHQHFLNSTEGERDASSK